MDEARLAAGERAPRELPLSIARCGGVPWRRKPSRHPGTTCPALKREEEGEDNDAGAWLVKQCPSWSPAARLDGKGNVDALENEGKQGKTVSWSPTCRILTLKRASSSPCCTLFERAMSPIECCGEDLEEGGSPLAMPLCAVGPPPLGAASPALFGVGATGGLQRAVHRLGLVAAQAQGSRALPAHRRWGGPVPGGGRPLEPRHASSFLRHSRHVLRLETPPRSP